MVFLFQCFQQRNKGQKRDKELKSTRSHQLNDRKLLAVFDSAISEGLQLHSQIWTLTISNGTLNT
jgi:hypothetical protein